MTTFLGVWMSEFQIYSKQTFNCNSW